MAATEPVSPIAARYGRTYTGRPRKAAAALRSARARAQEARQAGDRALAEEWEEVGDVLEALLAGGSHCSICGRALKKPESVARGVGPECWGKQAS